MLYSLEQILSKYTEKNIDNQYEPVAVGKFGIRKRSDIYKKKLAKDYSKNKLIHKDTMTIGLGSKQIDFGVLKENATYSVSPAYTTFRIVTSIVSSEYLELCLKANNVYYTQKYMIASARQGKKVDVDNFLREKLDIPDLKTQGELVERIEVIKRVVEKDLLLLDLLNELIKARFVEMFGDPVLNEKGWNTKPLLEMGSCKNGMNFHYEDSGIDINCLGVGDFKEYSVIENTALLPIVSLNKMPEPEYLLQDDDIVFVRSNGNKALVGRSVAVYPGTTPTTFSGFCIRYRKHDDAITIPYLLRVLKTDSIRMKMAGRGANIQNLNQQILGTLIIPVPPIDLQKQFSEFIKHIDKSKAAIQKRINMYNELLEKKMNDYFSN